MSPFASSSVFPPKRLYRLVGRIWCEVSVAVFATSLIWKMGIVVYWHGGAPVAPQMVPEGKTRSLPLSSNPSEKVPEVLVEKKDG